MDIDRDSRGASAAHRHDFSGAFAPAVRADGMVLGPSNESRGRRSAVPGATRSAPAAAEAPNADVHPVELQNLLAASEAAARERAWDAFLEKNSRLLLHVARRIMPAPDSAMDAYAYLLERLRRDECQVLAGYAPDGRSRFTTWLVVVARRMCVDFYRHKYGRPRNEQPTSMTAIERDARRRLESFIGIDEAHEQIPDSQFSPEVRIRLLQLHRALDSAVSGLQPIDQLLLKLRFHDEMSAQQIASVLAVPTPFHVYRRLKAVCAELRRSLLAAGVEDSAP